MATRQTQTSRVLLLLLIASLIPLPAAAFQSLGDVARRERARKKTGAKILTNEDLRSRSILGKTAQKDDKLQPIAGTSLSTFAVSPFPVVKIMLEMAEVKPGETVYDLGSGDGRIVIMAAEEFGARGVGIELDADLVTQSRAAVAAKGLEDKVRILHADILKADLSPADVVTLYLEPGGIELLRPYLERTLKSGIRVVSHRHPIKGWTVERVVKPGEWRVYLYRVR